MRYTVVFFLAAVMFSARIASAQNAPLEHAPSIQQCQADAAVWNQRENPDWKNKELLVFLLRRQEMLACVQVDVSQGEVYLNVVGMIDAIQATRMADFLTRHNLVSQFIAEDAAGSR